MYNLDRIDQVDLPLDLTYTYAATGVFELLVTLRFLSAGTSTSSCLFIFRSGTGVDVYVLDTGIRSTHTDFGGRAQCGFSFWNDECADDSGLGTLRAGIVVSQLNCFINIKSTGNISL